MALWSFMMLRIVEETIYLLTESIKQQSLSQIWFI